MEKLKVGIVGLGRLGHKHAENIAFRIPNAELKAVCSIVKKELEEVQASWGIQYGYEDFGQMLKNKELDAIAIASSSGEHCRQIEAALDAGFHVFSEKPLGITVEQCLSAEKAVERHPDKTFMLGFMRRYDSAYMYAKQKIDSGAIGQPIFVRAYGLDPESAIQGAIRFAPNSGGIFLDMAIHDIDLTRWFLNSEPRNLWATGGSYVHSEFETFNDCDNAWVMMQFENNTMAFLYSGRTAFHGYHIETEIVGTRGTLRIGTVPQKNNVMLFNETGVIQECVSGFSERFEQAYLNEMQEFVNCIIERRRPAVMVYDGTKSTKIAFAATESYRQGKLICL